MNSTCKYCGFAIAENFYFCPNCGKKLKQPPLSTSISKQIYIYAISILLPPLGLWPGIRYLFQKDSRSKIIGIIAIILTIVTTIITIKITTDFINGQSNMASEQLKSLENSGY